MTKEEIIQHLLRCYNNCQEYEKTDDPLKTYYCYGMIKECVREVLAREKAFEKAIISS